MERAGEGRAVPFRVAGRRRRLVVSGAAPEEEKGEGPDEEALHDAAEVGTCGTHGKVSDL